MKGIVLISLLAAVLLLAGCASPGNGTNANNPAPAPQNVPAANPNPQTAPQANPATQPANPNTQTNPTAQPSTATPQNPGAGITNGQPETLPAPNNQPADASGCPSPYDGTWAGTVSGSGEMSHSPPNDKMTPYIISYNLEVTFKCTVLENDYNKLAKSGNPDQQFWDVHATHVKISDPFFGCTNGCDITGSLPDFTNETADGVIPLPGEHGGNLILNFPNLAIMQVLPLYADPDGKRISGDQTQHDNLVAWSSMGVMGDGTGTMIEKRNCPDCYYPFQEGVTMVLDKIS